MIIIIDTFCVCVIALSINTVKQGSSNLTLEVKSAAEFSSNPD